MKTDQHQPAEQPPPKGRLILGGGIFVFGFLVPLFIPLVTASGLPSAWKAVLSGLLMFGGPELCMVIAVAVLGKPGYNYLKRRLYGLFKHVAPPDSVSRTRYRIGLIMFFLPLIAGWLLPYFSHRIPGYAEYRLAVNITGDAMFLLSVFVLGGDFWDKLRALFIHGAKAHINGD